MQMLITNLLAEAARIRRDFNIVNSNEDLRISVGINEEQHVDQIYDIKERWRMRTRNAKQHCRKLLAAETSYRN
ncbi:hypothetical protein SLE2022_377540 [Rubroshorea leprosula]